MSRTRLAVTVALFSLDALLGLALMHVLEVVGWPALGALLRYHGLG